MTRNVATPPRGVAESWVLKGIDPQARKLAREGARRSGVPVAEWLNQVIADAGEASPPVAALRDRETAARPGAATAAQACSVAARLDDLEREVAALKSWQAEAAPKPRATRALEAAVSRVAAELREKEARAELNALHVRETLAALWRRVECTDTGPPGADGLRAELLVLAERVERLEEAPTTPPEVGDGDEADLGMLLRIETSQRDILATLDTVNTALAGVESELQSPASGPGDAALDAIEASLRELDAQVAAVDQRSTGALNRMGDEVSRLARTLDGRVEAVERRAEDRLSGLGVEVARLAHTVELRLAGVDEAGAALLERISGRIAQVSEQLAARMADAEARGAQAVSEGLSKVAARLAAAEENLKQHHMRAALELAEQAQQSEARSRRLAEDVVAQASRAPVQPLPAAAADPPEPSQAPLTLAPLEPKALARWGVPGRPQPEPDTFVRRASPPVLSPIDATPSRAGSRELVERARAAARQHAEAAPPESALLLRTGFGVLRRRRN